jgi:hypothetical protein
MINQISSETLSLFYDNNLLFFVSYRDKNRSVANVAEHNFEYKKTEISAKFTETVFVISKKTSDLSNPSTQTFFSKFKDSISRNNNNCSILSSEENEVSIFEQLISDKTVKYIICWGVEDCLQIRLLKYKPLTQNGKSILLVDSMEAVEKDKDLKMKLWKTVQQMFK